MFLLRQLLLLGESHPKDLSPASYLLIQQTNYGRTIKLLSFGARTRKKLADFRSSLVARNGGSTTIAERRINVAGRSLEVNGLTPAPPARR